ncbi:MAG: VanW family protein [Lachnospiraceae bacterium]|nr:VanW family protein [Lachnospiraceae bacterium]
MKVTEKKRKILIAVASVVLFVIIGIGGYFYYKNILAMKAVVERDVIYNGISISGIDVSGLTKEEASMLLQNTLCKELDEKVITVYYGVKKWVMPYTDFEAKYDVDAASQEAFEIGRKGSLKERYDFILSLKPGENDISPAYSYNEGLAKEKITDIAKGIDKEPVDSKLSRVNGKFVITKEETGYETDIARSLEELNEMLSGRKEGSLLLTVMSVEPKVTREENKKSTTLIGSFSTKYSEGDIGRNINLEVACDHINGTVLKPGEIFSMNEALGPQTYENGYRNATIIVNGKLEDGLAGGVCQVSTTVYNAAIFSELEIVERRNHSLMVGYVPMGRDATLAGDYIDLKFKNNTDTPIYIEAYLENNEVHTNIYGNEIHEAGREVEFETVYEYSIGKPAEKVTEDPELSEGERVTTYKGKVGAKVSVYKNVYHDGVLISREWFSESTYKSTPDEVTVGTKKTDTQNTITNGNGENS